VSPNEGTAIDRWVDAGEEDWLWQTEAWMDHATLSTGTRDGMHLIRYQSMLEPLVGKVSGVNVLESREGLGLGRSGVPTL